jgi:hypothetical protein
MLQVSRNRRAHLGEELTWLGVPGLRNEHVVERVEHVAMVLDLAPDVRPVERRTGQVVELGPSRS